MDSEMLNIDTLKLLIRGCHDSVVVNNEEFVFNSYKDKDSFIMAEYYITILALLECGFNKEYYYRDKKLSLLQSETMNFILTGKLDKNIVLKNFKPTKSYK
jgi:hypothetical protein